jgi:hypothetical protein
VVPKSPQTLRPDAGWPADEARKVQYDLVTLFDTMIYSAEFPEDFVPQ